jgi:hypothetical protein
MKLIGCTLISLIFVLSLQAQKRTVSGKVSTFNTYSGRNIRIIVKSTGDTILTDLRGQYSLTCNKKDKLTFKADGFYTKRINITNCPELLNVNMIFIGGEINMKLAVDNKHIRIKDMRYAAKNLKARNTDFTAFDDIEDFIRKQVPKVKIKEDRIRIRGVRSGKNGESALIIVDRIVTDLKKFLEIPPSEVKTVNLLKKASIYGAKGAKGAIIVSTYKQKKQP